VPLTISSKVAFLPQQCSSGWDQNGCQSTALPVPMTERRADVNRHGHRKASASTHGASSVKRALTTHANQPASKRARFDDGRRDDEINGKGIQRKSTTLHAAVGQPQSRRRPTVPPTKQQLPDEEASTSDSSSKSYSSDSSTVAKKQTPVEQQTPVRQQLDEYGFELRSLSVTDQRLPPTLAILLFDITRCTNGFGVISLLRKVSSTFPHHSIFYH